MFLLLSKDAPTRWALWSASFMVATQASQSLVAKLGGRKGVVQDVHTKAR